MAERFGKTGFNTPVIESTGTGGGMKLFCGGVGTNFPDITNASRPIKEKSARKELIRFIAERHDGYLNLVLDCWKECERKEHFNGKESFGWVVFARKHPQPWVNPLFQMPLN